MKTNNDFMHGLIVGIILTIIGLTAYNDIEFNVMTEVGEQDRFTDNKILEDIKPYLKENTDFYLVNEYFKYQSNNDYYSGLFYSRKNLLPIRDKIIVVADGDSLTTLCHELMHKYWRRYITTEEKYRFIDAVNESGKLNMKEIKEMYADIYETDYERCYDDTKFS